MMMIYKWRPKEGWVQLFNHGPVRLADVLHGTLGGYGRRLGLDGITVPVSVDLLKQAREDGWDGS